MTWRLRCAGRQLSPTPQTVFVNMPLNCQIPAMQSQTSIPGKIAQLGSSGPNINMTNILLNAKFDDTLSQISCAYLMFLQNTALYYRN